MAEIPQRVIDQYEDIYRALLTNEAKIKHGRFSPEARRALAQVSRHIFFTPRILRLIEQKGDDPEVVGRAPLVMLPLGNDAGIVAIPPFSGGIISALSIAEGFKVLEVGTGSGYDAALAAHAAGRTGRVISLEKDSYLADHARSALERAGIDTVVVRNQDGITGFPAEAPYDAIFIDGLTGFQPEPLVEQLRLGGKMVCGVSTAVDGSGRSVRDPIVLIEKTGDRQFRTEVLSVPIF